MEYKNYKLDDFQIEAITHIDNNHSVVVSAATGTGKTLIADYAIDKFFKQGKHVVYTAPIKALSNQKYREFKQSFGEENVGIITGDVVINANAKILIMTTEIYRNMLLTKDAIVENVSYVIFDEIHFLSDLERGTVWEESIIFSPAHVRFICLSATIPNAEQFASWVYSIKSKEDPAHNVKVVKYEKRAVPLKHLVFDSMLGLTDAKQLHHSLKLDRFPDYHVATRRKFKKEWIKPAHHFSIVSELKSKSLLPAIYFVFSRAMSEDMADELSSRFNFTTKEEKEAIIRHIQQNVPEELYSLDSVKLLKRVLPNGIAVHHAGLLPALKDVVEHLFSLGMIKVLYATETFAVGINMPSKAVVFNSFDKFDGRNFRFLNSKEYFQIAGRAGRRGMDLIGYSIVMIDRRKTDIKRLMSTTSADKDPIQSQFKLSWNTVLNLIHNHTPQEIKIILESNFDHYQKLQLRKKTTTLASYNFKTKQLSKWGYIKDGKLTPKGLFARHIYSNEIIVSEIFATGLWKSLAPIQLSAILAVLAYEPRRADMFLARADKKETGKIIHVLSNNKLVLEKMNREALDGLYPLVNAWSNNTPFLELMEMVNWQEGDIIMFFRQVVDSIRQIIKAASSPEVVNPEYRELVTKLHEAKDRIYRDLVEAKM